MNDFRWTGRHGEKAFGLLCSKNSVTCNKAEEDDLGWDYIVHFPPPAMLHVPIDQRSSGVGALVQIKTTRVDAKRWSISLKNALALVRSPLPAFIVNVEIDAEGHETYHAVHVWSEDIARVLKAARRAHVEGDEAINHRSISFRFDDATQRPDLLGWMRNEIGHIGERDYASAKQILVDTLGFEDGHGVARLRFARGSPMALTDLQLGLIDSVKLDQFSFTPSRFGIEAVEPEIDIRGATISIKPQGRGGSLRLRSPDGQQVILPVEVFSAAVPGRKQNKIRIKAGFIDVVVSGGRRFTVKCREDRDRITTLDHIAGLALLRRSTRATKLTMSFKTDRSWEDLGYVNNSVCADRGWEQLFFITDALRKIGAFECADPITTSVNAISDQFIPLSVLDALVSIKPMRIEFTPHSEREGEVGAFLAYASVRFGNMHVGAVASRPVISDVMIGNRRRIDFGAATLLHTATDDAGVRLLPGLYLNEIDRMSEQADVLAIGDLQRSVRADKNGELIVDTPRRKPARLDQRASKRSSRMVEDRS